MPVLLMKKSAFRAPTEPTTPAGTAKRAARKRSSPSEGNGNGNDAGGVGKAKNPPAKRSRTVGPAAVPMPT